MILTRFYSGQGLGNQLWAYTSARSIAYYHKTPFQVVDAHLFKGQGFLDIEDVVGYARNNSVDESVLKSAQVWKERLFYDTELKYFAAGYDERVEKIEGDVVLEGLFQSERYLYENRAKLGMWLRLKKTYQEKALRHTHQCIVNIRGGEYKRHASLLLPRSYWRHAIDNMRAMHNVKEFLVVTDDRAYASRLLPDIPVLDGDIADCYAALHGAGYLIVSNSSFSYFPIKSRQDQPPVIAPYLWSRPSNVQNRWASPANFYTDWMWQSSDGNLVSQKTCLDVVSKTIDHYSSHYSIATSYEHFASKSLVSRLMPQELRRALKKALSKLFPMWIG